MAHRDPHEAILDHEEQEWEAMAEYRADRDRAAEEWHRSQAEAECDPFPLDPYMGV